MEHKEITKRRKERKIRSTKQSEHNKILLTFTNRGQTI